jgi:hypothetical protein
MMFSQISRQDTQEEANIGDDSNGLFAPAIAEFHRCGLINVHTDRLDTALE